MACWFFKFCWQFYLVKQVKFAISRNFPANAWRVWPDIWHVDVPWPWLERIKFLSWSVDFIIPPTQRSCWGYIGFTPSCPSVRPSVRPASLVRSAASTVQDGFFPYLVQMINSMRGCVACDDPWPWPISSRSFGLDLENCVRSVASTVLDGLFLYLAWMITISRGCVGC